MPLGDMPYRKAKDCGRTGRSCQERVDGVEEALSSREQGDSFGGRRFRRWLCEAGPQGNAEVAAQCKAILNVLPA